MPLRILLADESSNIKKAFQIALSDLGAEIKSVPSGLDVLSVTLDFKPNIIFADVLLTKKSGYEVCRELRNQSETKSIPVILMWSNFMEFDSSLAQQVGYTDKLEKPFDTNALRNIVTRFYKETETHPLKGLIDLPTLPDFSEEFTPVKLQNTTVPDLTSDVIEDIPEVIIETESHGDFEEVVLVQSNKNEQRQQTQQSMKNYLAGSPVVLNQLDKATRSATQQIQNQTQNRFDESLVREEVRVMAEKICWQMIPDIAEKIIREELEKLMKNIEKSV